MNPEDEFLSKLLDLQYGVNAKDELKKLSKNVSWAKNWPENNVSFWNAEAFMWSHKITKEKRELIKQELVNLNLLRGNNLDLGCGSYSYLPSVGFDLSPKMLDFNENCKEKIIGDLEQPLPFNSKFDSVTAIFVLNYIKNYLQLFESISQALKDRGVFIAVLSNHSVNDWQKQKEINHFSKDKWLNLLNKTFTANFFEKDNLLFFVGKKRLCRKSH